jgi:hypothetical protein
LPFVPRHRLGPSQFGHCAERIILFDVKLRFTLCAQFQGDAVDALGANAVATDSRRLLRRRRLRFGKWQ